MAPTFRFWAAPEACAGACWAAAVGLAWAAGVGLLSGLAYQRRHETQADCFALALMREAGLATAPTADLLLAIDTHAAEGPAWAALLSSHPQTPERAAALRAGRADGCR